MVDYGSWLLLADKAEFSQVQCIKPSCRCMYGSLVPRPRPAFRRFQYVDYYMVGK